MNIAKIWSLEIFDSRGFPTLKTFVELDNEIVGWAAVPSGVSTGTFEAFELRDQDPKRFAGRGVLQAKHNVEVIINDLLVKRDVTDQETIDRVMIEADGTENKKKLGANAILSVSLACARAAALSQKSELYEYLSKLFQTTNYIIPVPFINVFEGGAHAPGSVDFQEYHLVPYGFSKFSEAIRASAEVFYQLKELLKNKGHSTFVGDEGGFALKLNNNREPLLLLAEAIEKAGFVLGQEIALALDVAANELYQNNKYLLKTENKQVSNHELLAYYEKLTDEFPICSIEDPFAEDDWQGFVDMTQKLGQKIQLVGDDLYVTNLNRFKKGMTLKSSNAILIKPNQIGTLTETIELIKIAREAGFQAMISHRGGDTEDSFVADLSVATGVGQIKTGSLSRSERLVKYNRLLEIETREENNTYFEFPYKTNGNGY